MTLTADDLIRQLNLTPHPEGGWYRETWRADAPPGKRASGTAIYFLLGKDQHSHWHKVDATEIWLYHAGAPLHLELSDNSNTIRAVTLGSELMNGEQPQVVVPPACWQAARSLGDWTLVSCIVSPGFDFRGFELAPPEWKPGA